MKVNAGTTKPEVERPKNLNDWIPICGIIIVNRSKQITEDSQLNVPKVIRFIGNKSNFISGFTKVLIIVKFTGFAGKYVKLEETIRSFKGLIAGEYDSLPEQAFYMVGPIEDAIEKAKKLQSSIMVLLKIMHL